MTSRLGWCAVMVACAVAPQCLAAQSPHALPDPVEAAVAHWLHVTQLVNADSAAALYTPDAEMLQANAAPIVGRDAIRRFLRPFDGHAVVDTIRGTTQAIDRYGRVAYVWGDYYQVTHIDAGRPAPYRGRYVAKWRLEPDGQWRIARLLMQPAS